MPAAIAIGQMSQQELVTRVVHALESNRTGYMLTGSICSSLLGEPRSTHDIDIVVDLHEADVPSLLRHFPGPDFYLDEISVRDAVQHRSMFNLIDSHGDKVDFWLLTDEPFDRSRFARRRDLLLLGERVFVSTAEDLILMKLRWSELSGGSEKQHTDALRVYEVQREKLDMDYLTQWADTLGVGALLRRVMDESEKL